MEDEEALLEGLRAAESASLADPAERLLRLDAVSHEPAADHDAGPPAAGPAVDVDEAASPVLGVDLVEDGNQTVGGRDREVADRHVRVAGRGRDERRVRVELAILRQVEEERHTRRDQALDLARGVLGTPGTGVPAGDQATRLDDGGRTHDVQSAVVRYLVRGDRLNRRRAGADRRGMTPAETSASELRDSALDLAAEAGVDPGAWYVRVLEEGKREHLEPDLGALVRAYWELQRVTGRADLRDTWRALADQLWSGEAA